MADGEKTEQPTPKKLRDARKKGEVSKSADLTMALLFLAAFLLLNMAGSYDSQQLRGLMRNCFTRAAEVNQENYLQITGGLLKEAGMTMAKILGPLFALLFILALFIGFIQVGPLFAFEILKPKLEKLNPVQGFKRIFLTARMYLELGKNVLKLLIVTALVYSVVSGYVRPLILTARVPVAQSTALLETILYKLLIQVSIGFALVGAADFFLQKFLYMKQMRMSKYEVKQEYKQEEGDPLIKSMRHQLHEQLVMHNMVQEVKKADVVIVNPTHIAVALRYEANEMNAPQIVAKGERLIAEKIIEMAKENHIPIMRNIPLAHALNKLEVDEEIPEELYEAVAEVLNWVYKLAQEAQ